MPLIPIFFESKQLSHFPNAEGVSLIAKDNSKLTIDTIDSMCSGYVSESNHLIYSLHAHSHKQWFARIDAIDLIIGGMSLVAQRNHFERMHLVLTHSNIDWHDCYTLLDCSEYVNSSETPCSHHWFAINTIDSIAACMSPTAKRNHSPCWRTITIDSIAASMSQIAKKTISIQKH